jgi:hypothetical protein
MGPLRTTWERLVQPHASVTDPAQRRNIRLLLSTCAVLIVLQAFSALTTRLWNQTSWAPGYSETSLVVQSFGTLAIVLVAYLLARSAHPGRGTLTFIIGMDALLWWSLYLATGYVYHDVLLIFLLTPMGAAALLEGPTFNLVLSLVNASFILLFQLDRFANAQEALAVSVGAGAVLTAGLLLTLVSSLRIRDARQIAEQTTGLQAREERFRTIANVSGDGLIVSRDGIILFANPAGAHMFGFEPEDLPGKQVLAMIDPSSHDAARARLATDEESTAEVEFMRLDGRRIIVRSHSRTIPFEGSTARAASLRDVTAERRTIELLESAKREAEAAAKAKSDFLAMMSHEIRTPMNAMVGYADLLGGTPLDAQQHGMVAGARDAGVRMVTLVDNMMDFAKAEQGRLHAAQEPCDAVAMAREVVRLLDGDAKARRTTVRLEGDDAIHVLSDAPRLQQVLHNLLDNAIKFSEGGTVTVRMRATPAGDARDVTAEVRDTGIGMDTAMLARLFQPFSQAEQGMTRRFGGTGLGLAISQRLAKALGGAITVESELGKGSTFTFRFTAPVAAPSAPVVRATPAALRRMRILVAEDNVTNQKVLSLMLQRLGQTATVVDNGQKAVEAVLGDSFDVVLMDLHMPVMDGLEATRRIRAAGKRTRILAVTADALAGDREKCLEAGMDGYVPKPVRLEDLQRILAS